MKKIIVLGGSGYIGSYLINYFNNKKYSVINVSKSKNTRLPKEIRQINVDLSKNNEINKISHLLENSYVFVCIGASSVHKKNLLKNKKNIILGNLIRYSKNTKWILISSAGTVYGKIKKPAKESNTTRITTDYSEENILSEKVLSKNYHKYNYKYIICRLSNPYGKSLKHKRQQGLINILFENYLKKKKTKLFAKETFVRDFIYISDVASAIHKLILSKICNEIFNISYGKGVSIKNLISLINKVIPNNLDLSYTKTKKNDLEYSVANNSKLIKKTSWKIKINLKEGLRKTYKDLKKFKS